MDPYAPKWEQQENEREKSMILGLLNHRLPAVAKSTYT
jgi:hypothetical protein